MNKLDLFAQLKEPFCDLSVHLHNGGCKRYIFIGERLVHHFIYFLVFEYMDIDRFLNRDHG